MNPRDEGADRNRSERRNPRMPIARIGGECLLFGAPPGLGYSGLGRFLCAPSQSGGFAVCLHWHHQMVFFSATSYFTGCRPVPLWEPSQNGGWLERPQEHHQ